MSEENKNTNSDRSSSDRSSEKLETEYVFALHPEEKIEFFHLLKISKGNLSATLRRMDRELHDSVKEVSSRISRVANDLEGKNVLFRPLNSGLLGLYPLDDSSRAALLKLHEDAIIEHIDVYVDLDASNDDEDSDE